MNCFINADPTLWQLTELIVGFGAIFAIGWWCGYRRDIVELELDNDRD